MEELLYNILWIDDEHEKLSGFKGRAKRSHIKLTAFKSLNAGMSELERNYPFYDGVLLDAKFFENEDDQAGTEDTYNVHRAKERLLQLNKKFKTFVFTGQAEAFDDKTFNKAFARVYKKGDSEESNRLLKDIVEAAKHQEDTQLRHAHKRVFDVCTGKYIGEFAAQDLLSLLKGKSENDFDNQFNTIRKIVEDLFRAFNKFNLLPDEFVTPSVALNQSSLFLSGKEQYSTTASSFKQHKHLEETHIPNEISNYLKSILSVAQAGSHRSRIDEHVRRVQTPYLFKSVLYQLMDVLVWFKMHIDSRPKTANWTLYTRLESAENIVEGIYNYGRVSKRADRAYAFFKPDALGDNVFIPPALVEAYSLQDEMPIQADVEEYWSEKDQKNKTRVKQIRISEN